MTGTDDGGDEKAHVLGGETPDNSSNGFLSDLFQVLPQLLGLSFSKDERRIVRRSGKIDLHAHLILPDLHFTIADAVEVQGFLPDSNEVHEGPPFSHKLADYTNHRSFLQQVLIVWSALRSEAAPIRELSEQYTHPRSSPMALSL